MRKEVSLTVCDKGCVQSWACFLSRTFMQCHPWSPWRRKEEAALSLHLDPQATWLVSDMLPGSASPQEMLVCGSGKVDFRVRAIELTYQSCKMAESSLFGKWFLYTMVRQALNVFENKYIGWEFVGLVEADTDFSWVELPSLWGI